MSIHTPMTAEEIFRSGGGTRRYRTESLLDGSQYIRQHYAGLELKSFRNAPNFSMKHEGMQIGRVRIEIVKIDCGHPFEIHHPEGFNYYTIKIPLEGQCEFQLEGQRYVATAQQAFANNPGEPSKKRFNGTYAQIIICVSADTLAETLAAELGHPLIEPVRFFGVPQESSNVQLLTRLVEFNLLDLGAQQAAGHWRIARQFERSLLITLLQAMPNNYSIEIDRQRQEVAPFYVRRVEAFINEKLFGKLTMADLVKASSVSSRSLFYGFQRWRGTTPMAYLKAMRLDRARDELRRAAVVGGNITEIALAVGYGHLSRFSSDYRARFGERPSDTLIGENRIRPVLDMFDNLKAEVDDSEAMMQ
jgi:AraC-like DNA-binding protein